MVHGVAGVWLTRGEPGAASHILRSARVDFGLSHPASAQVLHYWGRGYHKQFWLKLGWKWLVAVLAEVQHPPLRVLWQTMPPCVLPTCLAAAQSSWM